MGILELRWTGNKQIECGYIVYKFGEVWFSNSRVLFAYFCTCVKKMVKSQYLANYLRKCLSDLNQIF